MKTTVKHKVVVKTKNVKEYVAVLALFYSLGYKFPDLDTLQEFLEDGPIEDTFKNYPHLLLEWDDFTGKNEIDMTHDLSYRTDHTVFNWSTCGPVPIIEALTVPTQKTMKISRDYNAVVTKDGIKVGCQDISFDDFDKLAKLVKEMRK